jgi:Arc/MetJ-type ribon-helix-helix transcriptional regulator
MSDERIVKAPIPLQLIRQMDDLLVSGIGGYESRAHFIRDAIESFILELTYPEAPQEPSRIPDQRSRSEAVGSTTSSNLSTPDFEQTVLTAPTEAAVPFEEGTASVPEAPLFGLHNRDYPSLWLASKLCRATARGPVSFDAFLDEATEEAWTFALPFLNATSNGLKAAALFPANVRKRQSSEQAFRTFAFGVVNMSRSGDLVATGPLFQWRICAAKSSSKGKPVSVGITAAGIELLRSLHGLSMRVPHEQHHADRFFGYLAANAPDDWRALVRLLRIVADRPNRSALVAAFHRKYPMWSPIHAATNAAGYVARGREWGLIEAKLANGCYELTGYGASYVRKANA